MALRQIACPGSGSPAHSVPSGKNPKVTCFRCQKRVGVIASSGKLKKHMITARFKGNSTTVIPIR